MNSNRGGLMFWVLGGLFAWILAKVFLTEGVSVVFVGMVGAALALAVFHVSESVLLVLVLLTLSLGSSYRPGIAENTFYFRFFLLSLVALRGVLLFLSARMPQSSARFGFTPVHHLFLLVGVLGLLTSYFSVAPGLSAQRAVSFLLLFFVIFMYFWIRLKSPEQCVEYGVAVWRTLAIVIGIGFLLLALGASGMFVAGRLRLVVGNPNQLGHYSALLVPIAIWYAMERARGRAKYLGWIVVSLLAVSLVWSGSRGGLIAAVAAVTIQFLLCYREKLLLLALVAGLGFSSHLLMGNPTPRPGDDPSFFQETVVREYSLESGSERTGVWRSAGRLIAKRPLFGYGFAVTDRLFRLGYFPDLPIKFQGEHVHNGYIEEILNLGWIGASPIFGSILYLLFIGAGTLLRPYVSSSNHRFACALFSVILAGSISGIFESWFTSVGSVFCFPFWFATALLLKMVRDFNDWSRAVV